MTGPFSSEQLLEKLVKLDEKLVDIWLNDDSNLSDEQIWDIFVVLLETRVELLKTCRDAGLQLNKEMCLPSWLDRLVTRRQEIRLREIRKLSRDMKKRKKILGYDGSSPLFDKSEDPDESF